MDQRSVRDILAGKTYYIRTFGCQMNHPFKLIFEAFIDTLSADWFIFEIISLLPTFFDTVELIASAFTLIAAFISVVVEYSVSFSSVAALAFFSAALAASCAVLFAAVIFSDTEVFVS